MANPVGILPLKVKHITRVIADTILAPVGLKISRVAHDWGDVTTFIPFTETIAKAKEMGLSVGDYVDARQGIPGATQATIDKMIAFGVFERPIGTIVEVGPGTGRYLEKTLRVCSPERYEVYETASQWAAYLARSFPVIVQPTNGFLMGPTQTESADLVQAHKVFSTVPFIVTVCYWGEMIRVTKPGAHIVFDAMTENCLTPAVVEAWARASIPIRSSYPAALPYGAIVDFFSWHNAKLVGTARAPMPPGETEIFVFRKLKASK
jgi:hypothetical protein